MTVRYNYEKIKSLVHSRFENSQEILLDILVLSIRCIIWSFFIPITISTIIMVCITRYNTR